MYVGGGERKSEVREEKGGREEGRRVRERERERERWIILVDVITQHASYKLCKSFNPTSCSGRLPFWMSHLLHCSRCNTDRRLHPLTKQL